MRKDFIVNLSLLTIFMRSLIFRVLFFWHLLARSGVWHFIFGSSMNYAIAVCLQFLGPSCPILLSSFNMWHTLIVPATYSQLWLQSSHNLTCMVIGPSYVYIFIACTLKAVPRVTIDLSCHLLFYSLSLKQLTLNSLFNLNLNLSTFHKS